MCQKWTVRKKIKVDGKYEIYRDHRWCRSGKSAVLDYLATKPGVRVMLADEIAHELIGTGNGLL